MQRQNLRSAYQHCLDIAKGHYENFPTASILLNRAQRLATAAIYAFARAADDIADEGSLDAATRLQQLDDYGQKLTAIYQGQTSDDPIFTALADTAKHFNLPKQTLADLLTAFRMDVEKRRYANVTELLNYCRYSANPIGELVLRLHNCYTPQNKQHSDRVCTSLQLINFVQDLDEDYEQRNRIYIPLDEMHQYAVNEDMLKNRDNSASLERLMKYQLDRAQGLLLDGVELVDNLRGKLKLVIALTISSGLEICDKLQSRQNCFNRPTLSKVDWVKIGLNTLYFRPIRSRAKIRPTSQ
jgi:hydroxysqualene synthase